MNMNAGDDNKKNKDGTNVDNGVIEQTFTTEKYSSQSQWGYQVLPSIYSIYQKVAKIFLKKFKNTIIFLPIINL